MTTVNLTLEKRQPVVFVPYQRFSASGASDAITGFADANTVTFQVSAQSTNAIAAGTLTVTIEQSGDGGSTWTDVHVFGPFDPGSHDTEYTASSLSDSIRATWTVTGAAAWRLNVTGVANAVFGGGTGGGGSPLGAAGGDLTGTYPNPHIATDAVTAAKIQAGAVGNAELADGSVTDTKVAAGNKDGTAGTPSLRTLGTGSAQATAGNDTRLSDARTPTAHAATHKTAGSDFIRLDELRVPSAAVSMNTQRLTGVGAPTDANDAATKAYVDARAGGLNIKTSVVAATTADITLSGEQTIDGVAAVTGDRVLVKDQTDQSENGLYVADSSAWARSTDADTDTEITGMFTFVESGDTQADEGWVLATPAPITLDTTDLSFTKFSAPGGTPTGSAGGDLTGTYPNPTIANDSVTAAKILAGAVGASEIADGSITDTEIATANKDGLAATPSLRTLGTGAAQAAAGNDARLSDSRTPTGSAGGDLTGTYPNPTVAAAAGFTRLGWVNVKDPAYAAAGNGTTDDTVAIQAAIAAAGNGGVVFFPHGDYLVTDQGGYCLDISSYSALTLIGFSSSRANPSSTGGGATIFTTSTGTKIIKCESGSLNHKGPTLENVRLEDRGGSSTCFSLKLFNNYTFRNVTCSGKGSGTGVGWMLDGGGEDASYGFFDNCAAHKNLKGITGTGSVGYAVNGGYFSSSIANHKLIEAVSSSIEIALVKFEGNDATGGVGVSVPGGAGVSIIGNSFEGCKTGVDLVAVGSATYYGTQVLGNHFTGSDGTETGVKVGANRISEHVIGNRFSNLATNVSDSGSGTVIFPTRLDGARVNEYMRLGGVSIASGTGAPSNTSFADGSLYLQSDAGSGTTLWVKQNGSFTGGSGPVTVKRKTATQDITNTTTMAAITDLSFAMTGNGTDVWFVEVFLRILAANSTMDFKAGWAAMPAASTTQWGCRSVDATSLAAWGPVGPSVAPVGLVQASTAISVGLANVATFIGLEFAATMTDGGTPGTVQFQGAQNTLDAGTLTIEPNSFLRITKLR